MCSVKQETQDTTIRCQWGVDINMSVSWSHMP